MSDRIHRPLYAILTVALLASMFVAGDLRPASADTPDVCAGSQEFGTEFVDGGAIAGTHATNVNCMAAYGITTGVDGGLSFAPKGVVTRGQMASFIARMMQQATTGTTTIPTTAPDAGFDDVTEHNTHSDAINFLVDKGVIQGFDATTYGPSRNVTRPQVASFIAGALDALGLYDHQEVKDRLAAANATPFTDLSDVSKVHRDNVTNLQALGIIRGFADGSYRPGNNVTRQQMSQFVMGSATELATYHLWTGVYIGATTPTIPAPTTPGPTKPGPTNPGPTVPNNQAFAVSSNETVTPQGSDVEFTADVDDAGAVTLWLFDADAVERDGQVITFDLEDDFLAEHAVISTVGDVMVGGHNNTVEVDEVIDGEVTFTVTSGSVDNIVAVVTEGDEHNHLNDDGELVADFGVSDDVLFATVGGLVSVPATDGNTRPVEAATSIDVSLVNGTGSSQFLVPADGQTLQYRVVDEDDINGSNVSYGSLAAHEIAFSGSVSTEDGVATIAFDGPEDPTTWNVYVRWTGSGAYQDQPVRTLDSANRIVLRYLDATSAVTSVAFVDKDVFAVGGTTTTLQAEVTDQFGDPIAGETVTFTGDALADATTGHTDASGIASLSYVGPPNAKQDVQAHVLDGDNAPITGDTATVTWYQAAAAGAHAGEVLLLSGDSSWVVIDEGGTYLRIDVVSGQLYVTSDGSATFPEFVTALEDEADADFDSEVNTQLAVDSNYGTAATTLYTLTQAFTPDTSPPSIFFTSGVPGDGQIVAGGYMTDNVAVTSVTCAASVHWISDPTEVGTCTVVFEEEGPYFVFVATATGLANGTTHLVHVTAGDAAGNFASAAVPATPNAG